MASTSTFQYAVRDRAGKLVSGKLEGESQAAVVTKLKSMGYAPVSITQTGGGMKRDITLPSLGAKVKLKDLAIMSRQFATMINSGLSLLRALSILADQTENKELAKVLALVRGDVETGQSLSASFAKHPTVFPPLMVNMCRAGEVGGFLDTVLLQIAENYEAEVKLRGKIKSAMTYPTVVFIIAIIAVIGMLLFIVPVFTKMFLELGGDLPAPTKVLVFMSSVVKFGAPFFVIGGVVGAIVWQKVKHTDRVRNVMDPVKLKLPVFGKLFQKVALSRYTRNLGTMLTSGVPILQSLDIVGETSGNVVLVKASRDIQESVRKGESLSGPLANHWIFPPMVVSMIDVGEETGQLPEMLLKVADVYDDEVDNTVAGLTSLMEPIMIVFLAVVVGTIVIALFLPLISIISGLQG